MTTLFLAAAAMSGLTVMLVLMGITSLARSRSELAGRLQTFSTLDVPQNPFDTPVDEQSGLAGRLNEYIGGRGFAAAIRAKLSRAGSKLTVPEFVLIKLGAALFPATVLLLFGQLLLGLLLGAVCFFIPDLWLRQLQRRRQSAFQEQLPDTIDLIVGGLRAGFSVQHSLANVAKQAPEPTASEFNRVGQEMQLGVPLMMALDNLVQRIESDDLAMMVSVFKIHSRVGGNLATVLATTGTTIRERIKLRREVKVITAMQRLSAYILGGLPPILAVVLFLLNPSYMREMFNWSIWLGIPIFAAIMTLIGFLVIRKLVDIKI